MDHEQTPQSPESRDLLVQVLENQRKESLRSRVMLIACLVLTAALLIAPSCPACPPP